MVLPEVAILPRSARRLKGAAASQPCTTARSSPWAARQTSSGAATCTPGGASASATSTSSATLEARAGCSLGGTMKRAIDSIQAASRSAGWARRRATGFCAERTSSTRSKPSATTACSSRLARPRFSASGSRPWSCGCTTASVWTPHDRSQPASAGSCAGSGVHSARSRS